METKKPKPLWEEPLFTDYDSYHHYDKDVFGFTSSLRFTSVQTRHNVVIEKDPYEAT